ncbi:hypothetical protein R3P38DRAFT_3102663 [Favolaschia claudopus]|uniref:Secreted protein n=1 Tax=Favolaschia claudopus TaxID=2862362 RepID=A0AAV9ZLG6_9AGAR
MRISSSFLITLTGSTVSVLICASLGGIKMTWWLELTSKVPMVARRAPAEVDPFKLSYWDVFWHCELLYACNSNDC